MFSKFLGVNTRIRTRQILLKFHVRCARRNYFGTQIYCELPYEHIIVSFIVK